MKALRLLLIIATLFTSNLIHSQWTWSEIGDGIKPSITALDSSVHIVALKESIEDGFMVYFAPLSRF